MTNLKGLRVRINSIKSTQKITKAMKMVASAKVKRSENATKAGRPFTLALLELFQRLMKAVEGCDLKSKTYDSSINNYSALLAKREIKTVGLLVLTSNKGLAGAYNSNLVKKTIARIKEYNEQGIKTRLFVVGSKGVNSLERKRKLLDFEIVKAYTKFPQEVGYSDSQVVAEDLADEYVNQRIDKVEIITTLFKNMMSYSVTDVGLLPLEVEKVNYEDGIPEPLMEFEPDADALLQVLTPMYFSNLIYHAFLEATASELASRTMAMSAASDNAEAMINNLTVEYNKARQFAITQELIEIVGGAGALKK